MPAIRKNWFFWQGMLACLYFPKKVLYVLNAGAGAGSGSGSVCFQRWRWRWLATLALALVLKYFNVFEMCQSFLKMFLFNSFENIFLNISMERALRATEDRGINVGVPFCPWSQVGAPFFCPGAHFPCAT